MKKIWLSSPEISGQEQKVIAAALENNEISMGESLNTFKSSLEKYLGQNVGLVGSGTAALHLALILSGISKGDEVFCASLTFSASANPIAYCGATPVFIDCEKETWNICPNLLEEAILDRKKKGGNPKAVIAVDLYGMPCDYDAISSICKKHGLLLIEDAAEALGSSLNGNPLGSFGDISILSFNANKIITTGGGGAIVSKDKNLIDKALNLAAQARDKAEYYLHSHIGFNYRMNNISAAMGLVQFKTLPTRVEGRRRVFDNYIKLFSNHDCSSQIEPAGGLSNRWLSTFTFNPKIQRTDSWESALIALRAANIESRPIWKPLHTQPIFKNELSYLNGNSEKIFSNGICLPSGSTLPASDQESIYSIMKGLI